MSCTTVREALFPLHVHDRFLEMMSSGAPLDGVLAIYMGHLDVKFRSVYCCWIANFLVPSCDHERGKDKVLQFQNHVGPAGIMYDNQLINIFKLKHYLCDGPIHTVENMWNISAPWNTFRREEIMRRIYTWGTAFAQCMALSHGVG